VIYGSVPIKSQKWCGELIGEDIPPKTVYRHIFPVAAGHFNETGRRDFKQTSRRKFFDFDLIRSVINYGARIKDVYLKIARDGQALPA
jgi:hypothetical protein